MTAKSRRHEREAGHGRHVVGVWSEEGFDLIETGHHSIHVSRDERPLYPTGPDRPACCIERRTVIRVYPAEVLNERSRVSLIRALEKLKGRTRAVERTTRYVPAATTRRRRRR